MNVIALGVLAAAGIGGAVYLARRSSAPAPKPVLKIVRFPRGLRGSAKSTLPDLPGLRELEAREPGFGKALLAVASETGADSDKLASYIWKRSGFDPHATMATASSNLSNRRGGVGLFGFTGSKYGGGDAATALINTVGDLQDYQGFEPTPSEYVRSLSAIEQVKGPLRAYLLKHPGIAKDPALHVIAPFMGNTEDLPGDPPKWDENTLASAPDSFVLIKQAYESFDPMARATPWDEQAWPELGNFDLNQDGVVTLGELREVYYKPLQGVGRFKP